MVFYCSILQLVCSPRAFDYSILQGFSVLAFYYSILLWHSPMAFYSMMTPTAGYDTDIYRHVKTCNEMLPLSLLECNQIAVHIYRTSCPHYVNIHDIMFDNSNCS